MVLGEGVGVILLKRLEEAVRDGDKIYAVIRSIETSSDGRAKSITAPDVNGQILALERTYEKLPFSLDTVSLIEAHGTGTWTGDIAEITALTQFVRRYSDKKKFIGLGSVKSMIGHLKAAAGMAGIIKVALALHNKLLPPTINCEQPRKDVDWEESPFYLLTEPRPWEDCCLPRRAAVDAFGFGGVNFHAVLEEAPDKDISAVCMVGDNKREAEFPAELFIFRAATRQGLMDLLEDTKTKVLRTKQADLRKIAVHFREGISLAGPTLTIVAKGVEEFISHLNKALKILNDKSRAEFSAAQGIYFSETPLRPDEKIVFLFPGFGSQYLNMGGNLPIYFPFVNEIFRKVDGVTACNFVLENGSTETETAVLTVAANTYYTVEFVWNGAAIDSWVDGVLQTRPVLTNLPQAQTLTPSIAFLSGAAGAGKTMTIDWMRAIQIQ
jgi:acyl transferase domain-containing protein